MQMLGTMFAARGWSWARPIEPEAPALRNAQSCQGVAMRNAMRGLLPAVVVAAALVNPAHAGIVSTGSVSSDYTGASQISD